MLLIRRRTFILAAAMVGGGLLSGPQATAVASTLGCQNSFWWESQGTMCTFQFDCGEGYPETWGCYHCPDMPGHEYWAFDCPDYTSPVSQCDFDGCRMT